MERYNGWANRATWLTTLWMDEYRFSAYFEARAKELLQEYDEREARYNLATEIESLIENEIVNPIMRQIECCYFYHYFDDMSGTTFHQIDYLEIAEHYMDNIR